MENMKNKRWIQSCMVIIITGVILVFICYISTIQIKNEAFQFFITMDQVQDELLPSTPAGQYYEEVFSRNLQEINEIYNADLFHAYYFTFPRLLKIYPGIRALVNEKGDTVIITSDQVNALQAELDWLLERCKPILCRDISYIEDRIPLTGFIGMTYREAWDYINWEYFNYNK